MAVFKWLSCNTECPKNKASGRLCAQKRFKK